MAGNPCPYLRAMAEQGVFSADREPLGQLTATASATFMPPGASLITRIKIFLVALSGSGLSPLRQWANWRKGLHLGSLRGGPFDKRGAGSRVLDAQGVVNAGELARLDDFAADYVDPETGTVERGLGMAQITPMMDANFARAAGHRRIVDRELMNGEWPVLLDVMGKDSAQGRYLSLREIGTLIVERRLPTRVLARIGASGGR